MSNKITFIDKKAQQLVDILNSGEKINGPAKPIIYLTIATVICLIGATIPHLALIACLGSLLSFAYSYYYSQHLNTVSSFRASKSSDPSPS